MIVTKNGLYPVHTENKGIAGATTILYISGVLGTASLELGYFDDFKNFIPLIDGGLGINSQTPVHGGGVEIYLRVAGADASTNLSVISGGKV